MTFEDWWKTVEEDVVDNCDNRMDEYDAANWLRDAFEAGQRAAVPNTVSFNEYGFYGENKGPLPPTVGIKEEFE